MEISRKIYPPHKKESQSVKNVPDDAMLELAEKYIKTYYNYITYVQKAKLRLGR